MIYFIQDQNLHHIKIGYTGDDPVGRLKALQTGSAAKLVLLGCVEGSQSEEAELARWSGLPALVDFGICGLFTKRRKWRSKGRARFKHCLTSLTTG